MKNRTKSIKFDKKLNCNTYCAMQAIRYNLSQLEVLQLC